jgi:hypothetical protein
LWHLSLILFLSFSLTLSKPLPPDGVSLVVPSTLSAPIRKRAKGPSMAVDVPTASVPLPSTDSDEGGGGGTAATGAGPANARMHVHMQLLLAFAFVGPGEAVAVQRPWLAITRQLPPKVYRPRYGT